MPFQGARAQRVEYLLLHAFCRKKYIVPDKLHFNSKVTKLMKRRINCDAQNGSVDDLDDANFNNDIPSNEHGKGKKGGTYAGGLVLEPKKGLYDKYVLLLDFNSLYPSIIQVSDIWSSYYCSAATTVLIFLHINKFVTGIQYMLYNSGKN